MSVGMIVWMAAVSGLAILDGIRFRLLEKRQDELDERLVGRVRVGDGGEREPPGGDGLAEDAGRIGPAAPPEAERARVEPSARID